MDVKTGVDKDFDSYSKFKLKYLIPATNTIRFKKYAVLLNDRDRKFPLQVHFLRGNNLKSEIKEIVMDRTATA